PAGSKDSDYRTGSHDAQVLYVFFSHLDKITCRATLHKGRDDQVLTSRAAMAEDFAFIPKGAKEIREFPLGVLHSREHDIVAQQKSTTSCLDFRHPHLGKHRGWDYRLFLSPRHDQALLTSTMATP